MALPKSREALTRLPIRPRSEGTTLIKEVNPLWGPRDSVRPGTYREALIMAPIKELSNTELPFESWFLSAGSQQFWNITLGSWRSQPTQESWEDSYKILLCRILYFMGGRGLLADEVKGDARKIKKWSRCKGQLGTHPIYIGTYLHTTITVQEQGI
jgi:hypothetical protein